MHTDTQTHSAAATHTTTLHTQCARHHGSNTQRRRAIANPPTTASSSAQRSHSRGHTQHLQHGVTVAAGSYTTAVRHCDCDMHDRRIRVALVRNMDCQRPPQPPTTHTQPLQRAITQASTQRSETHINEQSAANTSSMQRCAATQQPQRDAVQRRTRDNTNPQSQYCGTAPSAGNARPRRAFYIARMTQPQCFTFAMAQCTPHAHAD
jgi:hypothetical protein